MDFKGQNGETFHVDATGGVFSDTVSKIDSTYSVAPDGTTTVAQGANRAVNNTGQVTVATTIAGYIKDAVLAGIGAAFGGTVAGPAGAGLGAAAGLATAKATAPKTP